jgi:hypothetical protein
MRNDGKVNSSRIKTVAGELNRIIDEESKRIARAAELKSGWPMDARRVKELIREEMNKGRIVDECV